MNSACGFFTAIARRSRIDYLANVRPIQNGLPRHFFFDKLLHLTLARRAVGKIGGFVARPNVV